MLPRLVPPLTHANFMRVLRRPRCARTPFAAGGRRWQHILTIYSEALSQSTESTEQPNGANTFRRGFPGPAPYSSVLETHQSRRFVA